MVGEDTRAAARTLTLATLRDSVALGRDVADFERLFGESVEVTEAPARAEYDRVRGAAFARAYINDGDAK